MNLKIGRNDPCPCGSGKKYKQCCGRSAAPPQSGDDSHERAVGRALAWLALHHRKAFATALEAAIDDAVCAHFDDDDEARDAMAGAGDALWGQVQINLTEWLLAEGEMLVKGRRQRVAELLLGPQGPLFTTGQRAWLEQLARQPLRLYDVTEVVPGVSLTLCDALDTAQLPRVVIERAGSQSIRVGSQIGARVMVAAGELQLSGAMYAFTAGGGRAAQHALRELTAELDPHDADDTMMFGLTITRCWLAQFLLPAPLPQIVHSASGEPLLFTTDHYEVTDWAALATALTAQPDVSGDRATRWDRLHEGEDGLSRSRATITPQPGEQRVAVLYPTAGLAEQGRTWFDALAGDAVRFKLREVSDPRASLSRAGGSATQAPASAAMPPGLDAGALADALGSIIERTYAHWADEPIPALNDQTPRQAIQSPSGLERVKGLLRSYEDGEARQAAQQGRRQISYQFLWDALGLKR